MDKMKSQLTIFCEQRGISGRTKDAFGMWIRATYAEKFRISKDGETAHLILNKLSEDDMEAAWKDFVKELAKYLTENSE